MCSVLWSRLCLFQVKAKPHTAFIITAWLHSRSAKLSCLAVQAFHLLKTSGTSWNHSFRIYQEKKNFYHTNKNYLSLQSVVVSSWACLEVMLYNIFGLYSLSAGCWWGTGFAILDESTFSLVVPCGCISFFPGLSALAPLTPRSTGCLWHAWKRTAAERLCCLSPPPWTCSLSSSRWGEENSRTQQRLSTIAHWALSFTEPLVYLLCC